MTTSLWACGPYAFLAKGSADLCEVPQEVRSNLCNSCIALLVDIVTWHFGLDSSGSHLSKNTIVVLLTWSPDEILPPRKPGREEDRIHHFYADVWFVKPHSCVYRFTFHLQLIIYTKHQLMRDVPMRWWHFCK